MKTPGSRGTRSLISCWIAVLLALAPGLLLAESGRELLEGSTGGCRREGPYPRLRKGELLWIKVSLRSQKVDIMEGQRSIYTMLASSGLDDPADDRTPEGTFSIQRERGLSFYSAKSERGPATGFPGRTTGSTSFTPSRSTGKGTSSRTRRGSSGPRPRTADPARPARRQVDLREHPIWREGRHRAVGPAGPNRVALARACNLHRLRNFTCERMLHIPRISMLIAICGPFAPQAAQQSSPLPVRIPSLEEVPPPASASLSSIEGQSGDLPGGAGFAIYRWDRFPSVIVMDMADFRRTGPDVLAPGILSREAGYRGRLLSDAGLAGKHGWNAHDYGPRGLACLLQRGRGGALSPRRRGTLASRYRLARRHRRSGRGCPSSPARAPSCPSADPPPATSGSSSSPTSPIMGSISAPGSTGSSATAAGSRLPRPSEGFITRLLAALGYDPDDRDLVVERVPSLPPTAAEIGGDGVSSSGWARCRRRGWSPDRRRGPAGPHDGRGGPGRFPQGALRRRGAAAPTRELRGGRLMRRAARAPLADPRRPRSRARANAHPHVFISSRIELDFDGSSSLGYPSTGPSTSSSRR